MSRGEPPGKFFVGGRGLEDRPEAGTGLQPQVGALEAVVGQEIAGGAGQHEAAVLQHAGAVSQGQRLPHVGRGGEVAN